MVRKYILNRIFSVFSVLICHLLAAGSIHAAWQSSTSGTSQHLNGVYFVDSSTGWAVGLTGTILQTKNAGSSWSAQTIGVPATSLQDIEFSGAGASTGIVVGASGLILRTTDTVTWQTMNSGTTNNLNGVSWVVNTSTVWAAGAGGTVRVSTDSGYFWKNGDLLGNITGNPTFKAIFVVNDLTIWAAGNLGALWLTNNAGNTWTNMNTVSVENFRDIFFVGPSTGFLVGGSYVWKTMNSGGTPWSLVFSTSTNMNAVHFVSTDTGWVVGASGVVVTSTNSGNSFIPEASNPIANLNDVFFLNSTVGFAVGDSGAIIKYVPTTSSSTSETSEADGSLTPLNNVFDPSQGQVTTIRYYLRKSGSVSIKIYTLQGRLVRPLINEQRDAGTYQDVSWNGRNESEELVAPGIYLVHIEAPNFSSSKKIAVLR